LCRVYKIVQYERYVRASADVKWTDENPCVHAVGPRVLPAGKAVQRYWDTLHAPFPWPWEIWEVKG
jgi:hypothetical protein